MRQLGEFERAVLLAVIRLGERGYGVSIREELEKRLERDISFGAVYTTLDRLEEKGLVSASLGEPTAERGGRAKKFFRVEAAGLERLQHARRTSKAIWAITPLREPK